MLADSDSIVILDDDCSVGDSLVQLLDSDGLKAESFDDVEMFFARLRYPPVRLAVLDVWMPRTNGLKVQARLRKVSPETKVIVMTGRETAAIRDAALEAGAFAFLTKPFHDEAFLSIVRQALRPID
jgi:FixJ family two-component response regulator